MHFDKNDIPDDVEYEDTANPVSNSTLFVVIIILSVALVAVSTLFYMYHLNVVKSSSLRANRTNTIVDNATIKPDDTNAAGIIDQAKTNNIEDNAITHIVTIPRIESASASESKKSTKFGNYSPEQMLDGDLNTAWNAAWSSNIRVWIKVKLIEEAQIAKISIVPGYAKANHPKYDNIFKLNHRLKDIEIRFSSGRKLRHSFLDEQIMQDIDIIPPESCTDFTVFILAVYPSDRWSDVAISEIGVSGIESS